MFTPTSRYANLKVLEKTLVDGTKVKYVSRRLVPPASHFSPLTQHTVSGHERLDQIAARYLNDPEMFWQLCDANNAIDPDELVVTGRVIRITLPEGIAGVPPDA